MATASGRPGATDPSTWGGGSVAGWLLAENLGLGPSLKLIHEGLMKSPRHRSNLLGAAFESCGIGAIAVPSGIVEVQIFVAGD